MNSYKIKWLILLLLLISTVANAQRKKQRSKAAVDSLAAIKEFVTVSNGYKQLPLQAEIEFSRSSSIITSAEDTGTATGLFYISAAGSYIRIGEMEQLASDSLLLMVSDAAQQMFLYENPKTAGAQLQQLISWQMKDSSIQRLGMRYKSAIIKGDDNADTVRLTSRALVSGTTVPSEKIEIIYATDTKMPVKVVSMNTGLLPLAEEDYKQLEAEGTVAGQLLHPSAGKYYVIRTAVVSYRYKKIEHQPMMRLPVTIADRITRNSEGEYSPVSRLAGYQLTQNL